MAIPHNIPGPHRGSLVHYGSIRDHYNLYDVNPKVAPDP